VLSGLASAESHRRSRSSATNPLQRRQEEEPEMLLAKAIQTMESVMQPLVKAGTASKYDPAFYAVHDLTPKERDLFSDGSLCAPEGSILIVHPSVAGKDILVCSSADPIATGEALAKDVLASLKVTIANKKLANLNTVAIPGNATSPLAAAAFGRTVANSLNRPVAAIVTGLGAADTVWETLSGGTLMAPAANALYTWDAVLHEMMKHNPIGNRLIAKDVQDLTKSISEAATLFEILKDRMLEQTSHGLSLRPAAERNLKMVVSHSKGNWGVLCALLNLELNDVEHVAAPAAARCDPKVHIVTFGNWVNLPDLKPIMADLFHYHQFMGMCDQIGGMGSSYGYARLLSGGKWVRNDQAVDHNRDPDEALYAWCCHGVDPDKPHHMPIRDILRKIDG
jgi:hypothetical protein